MQEYSNKDVCLENDGLAKQRAGHDHQTTRTKSKRQLNDGTSNDNR